MTIKILRQSRLNINPRVRIGPRVRRDIEQRIRELENRFKPSHAELRELARLRELMRLILASGGGT